jgi:biotin operon repressor
MKIVKHYSSDQEKFKAKLIALNGLINLTDAEIEMLSWFLYFREKYHDDKSVVTFHSFIRKKVMGELNMSAQNLTMKIQGLKKKGIVVSAKDSGLELEINSSILKLMSQNEVTIVWQFREK